MSIRMEESTKASSRTIRNTGRVYITMGLKVMV
jgi:hypothetical protein